MQNTIRELYYTERKGTYDPHGWDKLSLCLTDRYNAGVLDNPLGLRPRAAFSRPRSQFFPIRTSQPANNIYFSVVRNPKSLNPDHECDRS